MLYYCYKTGRALALRLPIRVTYAIAVWLADIYYIFAKTDRENISANLRIILKTDDQKLLDRHAKNIFRNFAKYLADFLRFSIVDRDFISKNITLEGREYLDAALARGKGVICLSAHLGNWELGGAIVGRLGYDIHAIALNHSDRRVNDFFQGQRLACRVSTIPIGAQLKNCFKILRKNMVLAILADRDFSDTGMATNFFGHQTVLPKGPAFFSLKTDALTVPVFCIRTEGDKFRFVFQKPLEIVHTGDKKADASRVMQQYVTVIERFVREHPDQWYMFQKVWKK